MSLQAFYGTRNGRKQLSHKRKSIIYLLYYLDLSTGFRLGGCIQNQIYFIDSKYLHCSNNFCSCANILKLQSQISNRHLIGLYWIVFIFHQIIKGSARKKNHVFILPHRNSLYCYDTYRVHVGILNMIILFILSRYIQYKNSNERVLLNKYYCRMQVTFFLLYQSQISMFPSIPSLTSFNSVMIRKQLSFCCSAY